MDDCISRQDAIALLEEAESAWLRGDILLFYPVMLKGLKKLPSTDAVPVVRCKDCEHKDRESGFCHGRGWPMQLVPDDGFCDKGKERREGAQDEN